MKIPHALQHLSLQHAVPEVMRLLPIRNLTIQQMLSDSGMTVKPLRWRVVAEWTAPRAGFQTGEIAEAQGASPILALTAFWNEYAP